MAHKEGLGTLRLRFGDYYIIVRPKGDEEWDIHVLDSMHEEVEPTKREEALRHLLRQVSHLRKHIFKLLGGK